MISGSIQTKKGYYYCVLNLRDTDGKRTLKWVATGLPVRGNKRRAQECLQQCLSEHTEQPVKNRINFCSYCENWLADKKVCLEETTYVTYKSQIRHITDYFSETDITLDQLTPAMVNQFYNHLSTAANKSATPQKGSGLSARTIKDIAQLLRSILNTAVTLEQISKNPAKGIKPPVPLDPNSMQDDGDLYLDEDDLSIFYRAIAQEPLRDLFIMTLYCGFRREEAAGLNWARIDFSKRTIEVLETRVRAGSKEYTKARTKNHASHRVYPMGDFLYQFLTRIQKSQKENRRLFGSSYTQNNGEVFTWPDGRPFRLDYITNRFKKIIRSTPELDDRLHFHDLRKTCISNLFLRGYSIKEVQKWVGQEDVETTIRIYNRVKQKEKTRIVKTLDTTFQNTLSMQKC